MPHLRMRDFLTVKVKDTENKRYMFECKDSNEESGHSLYTTVEATHAGIVNGNMRFYRPDRMQDGCHTWTSGTYPRPVLVRHDEEVDPLGRVAKAKYLDFSSDYAGRFPNVRKLMFYDSSRNRMSLFDSVDWVVKNLNRLQDYRGLGAIELGMNVTNPEAIGKVLRDEYLTVSVGFQTDSAICSVCHTDWAEDDKCEHRPGQVYDGKKMFLISGAMKFDEVSFVNFPADPFAVIKTKGEAVKAMQDSLATRVFFLGLPSSKQFKVACADELEGLEINYDSDIIPVTGDPRSEDSMKELIVEIKSPGLTKDRAFEIKASLLSMTPTETVEKRQVTRALNTINAVIRQNDWNEPVDTPDLIQAAIADLQSRAKSGRTPELEAEASALKDRAAKLGIEFELPVEETSDHTDATNSTNQDASSQASNQDDQASANAEVAEGLKDGKSESALAKVLDDLESIYNGLEEKYMFFDALDALMRKVSAENYLTFVKKHLTESDEYKEMQRELDTLHAGAEKAEAEIADLKSVRDALAKTNSILTSSQKRTLATAITLFSVLRKDSMPSPEEIHDEIEKKAKRQLVSLQDSLNDLLEEIPQINQVVLKDASTETKPVVEVTDETATEGNEDTSVQEDSSMDAREVDDKAEVTEQGPDQNVEEQKDTKELDAIVTPLLSPREIRRLQAQELYRSLK